MSESLEPLPALVAFDLDDTLAPSKSPLDRRMAGLLGRLLTVVPVCIISGGHFEQFRTQVVHRLGELPAEALERLHLMPTCGTQYYRYEGGDWARVYSEDLTPAERERALTALEECARELGLWEERSWGPVLEDRGSQITFSALGQAAPVEAKRAWDPTGEKKDVLRQAVAARLPELEVRSGGSTSVDVTRRGIDKAYGMRRLSELTGLLLEDVLFLGDRLDPAGNDYPVLALGVRCRAVDGWEDTADYLETLIPAIDRALL